MFIKDVLREELDNSLQMKKNYERSLAELPKGSLVRREIKGHDYYYLVYRQDGQVKSDYRGKVSEDEIAEYNRVKQQRSRYRSHLSEVNKQIRFIKKVLHAKESV